MRADCLTMLKGITSLMRHIQAIGLINNPAALASMEFEYGRAVRLLLQAACTRS